MKLQNEIKMLHRELIEKHEYEACNLKGRKVKDVLNEIDTAPTVIYWGAFSNELLNSRF